MTSAARLASLSLACVASLACTGSIGKAEDPESLGYGPATGSDLSHGYGGAEGPPFERLAPTAWPLDQQPLASSEWVGPAPVLAAPPILASDDTRRLCVHVVEFLLADSGEPLDAAILADTCHLYARTEKLARTAEQWQLFSGCMLTAETEAAFDRCEDDHPSSLAEPSDHPREREACQHLVMTTLYEQVGNDANLPASELERFRPVIRECVDGLITKDLPKRSPEDYAALLDCVLEQSTSAAMEACE